MHRSIPRGSGPPAPSHPDCVIDDEECGVDGDGPAMLESTVDCR